MESRGRFLIAAAIVLLAAVMSLVYAPSLPERLATHWNAVGQPDGTLSKPIALAFIPVIAGVTILLFAVIPRIDPLGENIVAFQPVYDWFVVVFAAFMTAIHAGIIAFNLGYEFDFTLLVLVLVAGLLFYAGILLSHAKRNWFVGIRTPWTLSSEPVWNRTHKLGSRLFKLAALVTLLGLVLADYAIYFLILPAMLTAGITVVYSYYLYSQIEEQTDSSTVGSR